MSNITGMGRRGLDSIHIHCLRVGMGIHKFNCHKFLREYSVLDNKITWSVIREAMGNIMYQLASMKFKVQYVDM